MDGHQGPPPRREHGDRDQGHPKHHFESGPAIIEPMIYRGGGRGMRGGARGAPMDRPHYKSRDDFNVAPRYFDDRDDLRGQGPPHSGPHGYFNERQDHRERDYYRNMQDERMVHKRGFEPANPYFQGGRDGPVPMRGGHRGGGNWGFNSRYQGGYGGYNDQQQQPYRQGKPGGPRGDGKDEPMRYNQGSNMDYDGRGRYQGNDDIRYKESRGPMRGGHGAQSFYPDDMHDREDKNRGDFDEPTRGGRMERGGPMRGRRGGPGAGGATYGSNRYGPGSGTGNNNNDDD